METKDPDLFHLRVKRELEKSEQAQRDRMTWLLTWFIGVALLGLIALAARNAEAATVNVSWAHPTQYVDGTPLPVADVKETRVEVGTCGPTAGSMGTVEATRTVAGPATSTSVDVPGFGAKCARAYTVSKYDTVSEASVVATRTYPAPNPRPPVVTIATTAYELREDRVEGVRLGRAVGTVPLGTACEPEPVLYAGWTARPYHAIPASAVALTKAPKSDVLVAICGGA